PTFDLKGNVIGINTAIYSPNGGSVGIGFAIPANRARPVVEQLKEHGKVARGWLGIQIQAVTAEIARNLGLANPAGALVAKVGAGSPPRQPDSSKAMSSCRSTNKRSNECATCHWSSPRCRSAG